MRRVAGTIRRMATVVHLHVGAPKTGTTYLQARLRRNRASLRDHGVTYPIGNHGSMFLAALDLIDRPWAGQREAARGEWDDLMARVSECAGKVVISHEILAAASAAQVERAMAGLQDAEVHLVYSARDLARQIPSEWQEGVKHAHLPSFERFLGMVQEARRPNPRLWFWRVQGLPDVLSRWASTLPASRVHLVTVPPAGADRDLLWQRYCRALDIDPDWAPEPAQRENLSIGAAEATLIRRLNHRLEGSDAVDHATYRRLVRQRTVHEVLAHRPSMVPVTLPPEAFDWAEEVTEEWIGWVRNAGIEVVGDLGDLWPVRPDPETNWVDPDRPRLDEMLDIALDTIEVLLADATETSRKPIGPQPSKLTRVARRARSSRLWSLAGMATRARPRGVPASARLPKRVRVRDTVASVRRRRRQHAGNRDERLGLGATPG